MGLKEVGRAHDHILYYATQQPTLKPLHHQLAHLTYGGVTAMDVPGQERNKMTLKG